MLDIGWPELLVVAIVLILVVGPKDLPRMLRTFGRTMSQLRTMAADFRRQFDDALREAELDEVKSMVEGARSMNPTNEIKKHLSPLEKAGEEVRKGLDAAIKPGTSTTTPSPAKGGEPASTEVHAQEPAKAGATAMPGESVPHKPDGAAPLKGGEPASRKAHAQEPAKKGATAMPGEGAKKKPAAKPRGKAAAKSKPAAKPRAATAKKASKSSKAQGAKA